MSTLTVLSAVDGRYHSQTESLRDYFSEAALIRYRIEVEVAWLNLLLEKVFPHLSSAVTKEAMQSLLVDVRGDQFLPIVVEVKNIEKETKHDVKAVEYWLAKYMTQKGCATVVPCIHFGCTSWDVNNIAYSLQVQQSIYSCLCPALSALLSRLKKLALEHVATPMLSLTHGQPASPTTIGKELANYYVRLLPRLNALKSGRLPAKFNGAVGNYNAHVVSFPDQDWQALTKELVESFGFVFAPMTTQIEPYDTLSERFDELCRINAILLDLSRDCWLYISRGYFSQRTEGGRETGSSTMPHKINPIDFENGEGNLGISTALLSHLSGKLPISRLQRDLSDSTALRTVGTAFGHTLIAWKAISTGLEKIEINKEAINIDLENNWEVLAEAVQSVLRVEGIADAYDQLKELTRGKKINAETLHRFIQSLDVKAEIKDRLCALTPQHYIGLATSLAQTALESEPDVTS